MKNVFDKEAGKIIVVPTTSRERTILKNKYSNIDEYGHMKVEGMNLITFTAYMLWNTCSKLYDWNEHNDLYLIIPPRYPILLEYIEETEEGDKAYDADIPSNAYIFYAAQVLRMSRQAPYKMIPEDLKISVAYEDSYKTYEAHSRYEVIELIRSLYRLVKLKRKKKYVKVHESNDIL